MRVMCNGSCVNRYNQAAICQHWDMVWMRKTGKARPPCAVARTRHTCEQAYPVYQVEHRDIANKPAQAAKWSNKHIKATMWWHRGMAGT